MKRKIIITQTELNDLPIKELENHETDLTISEELAKNLFVNNYSYFDGIDIELGPFDEFNEPLILNKNLDQLLIVFEQFRSRIPDTHHKELNQVIQFVSGAKKNKKDIQFWL